MDKINLNIVLIAGYTTHGKSTFKDYFKDNLKDDFIKFKLINFLEDKKLIDNKLYKHYYFSKPVKEEITRLNNITLTELQENKEQYRSQMIESCIKHLEEDEYYYVDFFIKEVQNSLKLQLKLLLHLINRQLKENNHCITDETINNLRNTNYIIDDWRFKREYNRIFEVFSQDDRVNLNIITVRVVNQKAKIPDLTRQEEHDLDDVFTDNLVLTEDTTLEYVRSIFPQYQ